MDCFSFTSAALPVEQSSLLFQYSSFFFFSNRSPRKFVSYVPHPLRIKSIMWCRVSAYFLKWLPPSTWSLPALLRVVVSRYVSVFQTSLHLDNTILIPFFCVVTSSGLTLFRYSLHVVINFFPPPQTCRTSLFPKSFFDSDYSQGKIVTHFTQWSQGGWGLPFLICQFPDKSQGVDVISPSPKAFGVIS